MNNVNVELLNYTYQNAQMGSESVEKMLGVVNDQKCLEHLQIQKSEYEDIRNKARMMLIENGSKEKDINAMAKLSSSIMIGMKTLTDKSPQHIAEMMIQGSTMGVVEATKNLKQYKDADKEAVDLTKKLLRTEESNLEHWKKML